MIFDQGSLVELKASGNSLCFKLAMQTSNNHLQTILSFQQKMLLFRIVALFFLTDPHKLYMLKNDLCSVKIVLTRGDSPLTIYT